jgi:hypothetical protein
LIVLLRGEHLQRTTTAGLIEFKSKVYAIYRKMIKIPYTPLILLFTQEER